MKIGIDKSTIKAIKKDNNEYIYLYEEEPLKDLLNTELHCIYYKNCNFVDINLTNYDIDCFKKCSINDIDWDKLPEKVDYRIIATEPAIKGNTATNATKDATIETGLLVRVPLFIEQDEEVLVSSKDGKYVSRA